MSSGRRQGLSVLGSARYPKSCRPTGHELIEKASRKPCGHEKPGFGEEAISAMGALCARPTEPGGKPAIGGMEHTRPDREAFRNQHANQRRDECVEGPQGQQ